MGEMTRLSKIFYYLEMAKAAATRSTCIHNQWGAVIEGNDELVSTGYNGAPRGTFNCNQRGYCFRDKNHVPTGMRYELCCGVHAAQNAIIHAARFKTLHSNLYIYGWDADSGRMFKNIDLCILCKKAIINAGLAEVIFADPDGVAYNKEVGYGYQIVKVSDWVKNYDKIMTTLAERENRIMEGQ